MRKGMRQILAFVTLATSLSAVPLVAQAPERPDFSGEWTAIMEDGNLIPPYLGENIRIEHKEPLFTITSEGKDGKPIVFRFRADGRNHSNSARDNQVRTTAKWDGDALILSCELTAAKGEQATTKERWTLAPNRRKLAMQGYFAFGAVKKNQLLEYQRK